MIRLSINKDIKLEKGKENRKTGGAVGLYKYLARAAKALVVSEIIVENSTRQYKTVCAVILPPPLEKLALKLCRYPYYTRSAFLSLCSTGNLLSLLC